MSRSPLGWTVTAHVLRNGAMRWPVLVLMLFSLGCDRAYMPIEDDGHALGEGGSGADPEVEPAFFVSVLAESEPGGAPALLTMVNETSRHVTAVVGATSFYAIAPGDTPESQLAASADIAIDAAIGIHLEDNPGAPCSFLPVLVGGVTLLEPGRQYRYRVFEAGDTLAADISDQGPASPFVAVRASAEPETETWTLRAQLAGGEAPELFLTDIPTPYQLVGAKNALLERLELERAGSAFAAEPELLLAGAVGFTLHVGASPMSGGTAIGLSESP